MRLRAAKLHMYAVQQADGLSATFSMLHCCVAAGLDGSPREMQNCYNSEKHVKQQVAVGLDVALDSCVVNQWTAARARSDPKAPCHAARRGEAVLSWRRRLRHAPGRGHFGGARCGGETWTLFRRRAAAQEAADQLDIGG